MLLLRYNSYNSNVVPYSAGRGGIDKKVLRIRI
jgi:hypothetical protein